MATRIVLADDHAIVREGLVALLAADPSLEVVATVDNGRDAVRVVADLRPDIVIMDIGMRELNGIEATRQILARCPDTRVIALSMHKDRRFVSEMLLAGASGYVVKDSSFGELIGAVHAVTAGRSYLSPECTGIVVEDYVKRLGSEQEEGESRMARLSPREREVLQLMAEGHSTKEIAAQLYLSPKTIESHRRQIMEKLDIFSVAGLVKFAVREGLASLDE